MTPFKEATYEQLWRILEIVQMDSENNQQLELDFLLAWTYGETLYPNSTTEAFIQDWERLLGIQ